MTVSTHPSIALIEQLNPGDLAASSHLFADSFVWHFFNPKLANVHGDYVGVEGLKAFFEKLHSQTDGTFQVEPISLTPVGNELAIAHVKDQMTLDGDRIELDAVVVWRIVDGLIAEAWDIPSLYTEAHLVSSKGVSPEGVSPEGISLEEISPEGATTETAA